MIEHKRRQYTTKLQAGLGLINETENLIGIWRPGMSSKDLYRAALDSGNFSNISARRLRNIVSECFAPRYMKENDYPVALLKSLTQSLSTSELRQLFMLYTARANQIFYDFVVKTYWTSYGAGNDSLSNERAMDFVVSANQEGHTSRQWSEITMQRVASYLTGCCADFGLLEEGRKSVRRITPPRIEFSTIIYLAYDLHFQGIGDNSVINHSDWQIYGLEPADIRNELKGLSKKGFFIIQTAGDAIHIGWNYKSWEELLDVIPAV